MHTTGYRIAQLGGLLIVIGGLFDMSLREPLVAAPQGPRLPLWS
jgi:hypothetical protein